MDAGDIYRADLNDEVVRRVVIVSTRQFHRLASRVVVVPELRSPPEDVPPPWRIEIDGTVFAVDMSRSLPVDRLVERVDRCTADTLAALRRVLQHIT